MDFDEYEYLERTVEDQEVRKNIGPEKSESGYRRRDREDGSDGEGYEGDKRIEKRSRAEEDLGWKRERDERERYSRSERHRSDRDLDRKYGREMDGERERGSRERERERERGRDRESGRERDRERSRRDRERDTGKEEEKDRKYDRDGDRCGERERERSKGREREGSRERGKDRERDREERVKEREKEWERERERSRRSRSRSRRYEGDGERDREMREREHDIDIRENRKFKEKKEAAEPEADPERDQRTVFAYQMPLKATERDVYEFFSQAGKVRDVRLIMDRNSRRSKGVGYIEFYDVMTVPMAIALSGHLLLGKPIMVKPSEAEKNLVQSTAAGGSGGMAGPYGPVDRKLYVGNLHFNMTEHLLRQVFEPFGTVELVQLPLDPETGHCKGFGFVQFSSVEHAKAAQSLNGKLEIAGRSIKVSSVTDHVGVQDIGTKAADFDDDDGGGLALNAQSRALLMQKLDRSGIASTIAGSLGVPAANGPSGMQPTAAMALNGQAGIPAAVLSTQVAVTAPAENIGNPSECLLVKNMFDPAAETDPEFDLDIKEDVEEECSKFGRVIHIYVDKMSAGYVYLRFETVQAATLAQRAMHMRWFARRLISAVFMQPYEYDVKFRGGGA